MAEKAKCGRKRGVFSGKTRKVYKTFSVSVLPDDYAEMKRLADGAGKSMSRYIVETLLNKNANNT